MEIRLILNSRLKHRTSLLEFVLGVKIGTSYEVQAKSLLTVVAEVGGYLGLTLGISLLDLKTMVYVFFTFFQAK